MLMTVFMSLGTPMLMAGDEFGRTQQGNNNAYCQDNETGWVGWENLNREDDDFTEIAQYHVLALQVAVDHASRVGIGHGVANRDECVDSAQLDARERPSNDVKGDQQAEHDTESESFLRRTRRQAQPRTMGSRAPRTWSRR